MATVPGREGKKGQILISIHQEILDRLEPFKGKVNLSVQTERFLSNMLDGLESPSWAERNAEALKTHGRDIAATGLAGAEFERI